MNKRRRAYKKYDWKAHQKELFMRWFKSEVSAMMAEAIDNAVLYGTANSKASGTFRLAVPDCMLKYLKGTVSE